jgi:hypothetical protein
MVDLDFADTLIWMVAKGYRRIKDPCVGCFNDDLASGCKYKLEFDGYSQKMCDGITAYKRIMESELF